MGREGKEVVERDRFEWLSFEVGEGGEEGPADSATAGVPPFVVVVVVVRGDGLSNS